MITNVCSSESVAKLIFIDHLLVTDNLGGLRTHEVVYHLLMHWVLYMCCRKQKVNQFFLSWDSKFFSRFWTPNRAFFQLLHAVLPKLKKVPTAKPTWKKKCNFSIIESDHQCKERTSQNGHLYSKESKKSFIKIVKDSIILLWFPASRSLSPLSRRGCWYNAQIMKSEKLFSRCVKGKKLGWDRGV